jgi:hypothetical protein
MPVSSPVSAMRIERASSIRSRSSRALFSRALKSAPSSSATSPSYDPTKVPKKVAIEGGCFASHSIRNIGARRFARSRASIAR